MVVEVIVARDVTSDIRYCDHLILLDLIHK